MTPPADSSRRATVRLTLTCNNRCVFCAQRGLHAGPERDPQAELRTLAASGATEVTFVGGEPTLYEGLSELISLARAQGLRRIGLQTNARRLGGLPSWVEAGLTDLHFSLLGAEAAVHEYHTGIPGSFEAVLAGLDAARQLQLTTVATTVVTRSNFRVLAPIGGLLQRTGASAWGLSLAAGAGGAGAHFDRVVPRLGLALPYMLQALDRARGQGLPTFVAGAPLCALGPFARFALGGEARAFGDKCTSCTAQPGCTGVDARYLRRFGEEELKAVSGVPLEHEAIARLLVGTGELFVADPAEVPPPPVAVRSGLKALGKVKPAAAEMTPGTPKRSGEALKEIFPSLFVAAQEKPPVKP
jgi:hypothetical protein